MSDILENLEVINILLTNDKYRIDTLLEKEPNNKLKEIYNSIENIQQELLNIAYMKEGL